MSATAIVPPSLPAENGVHVWRAAVIMPIFTACFVGMRFYSRKLRGGFSIDDYTAGLTMIFIIVHAILMTFATYNGMGLHVWQYSPELNQRYYLWIGISSQFYVLSLAGFKSTLLLVWLQLFGNSKKFRIACYIALFYTLGYLFCNLLTEFLGCTPIAKKWNSALPGKCINGVAANIAYGFGHMTSDLVIAILPIVGVWRLKFPTKRQKLGLSLALSSGFLAWAVACIRWAISTYNMLIYDRPWWAGISFTFSILEVNTGLICACIVTFSPLLHLGTPQGSHKNSQASDFTFSSDRTSRKASAPGGDEKDMGTQLEDYVPPPALGYNAAPTSNPLLSWGDQPRFTAEPYEPDPYSAVSPSAPYGGAPYSASPMSAEHQNAAPPVATPYSAAPASESPFRSVAYQNQPLTSPSYGAAPFDPYHPMHTNTASFQTGLRDSGRPREGAYIASTPTTQAPPATTYNAVRHNDGPLSAVPYGAAPYNAGPYQTGHANAAPYEGVPVNAGQPSIAAPAAPPPVATASTPYSAGPSSATHYAAAPSSAGQYDVAPPSAVQYTAAPQFSTVYSAAPNRAYPTYNTVQSHTALPPLNTTAAPIHNIGDSYAPYDLGGLQALSAQDERKY